MYTGKIENVELLAERIIKLLADKAKAEYGDYGGQKFIEQFARLCKHTGDSSAEGELFDQLHFAGAYCAR